MRREHRVWTIGTIALALCATLGAPRHGHAAGVPSEVFEQMQRITQTVHRCYSFLFTTDGEPRVLLVR